MNFLLLFLTTGPLVFFCLKSSFKKNAGYFFLLLSRFVEKTWSHAFPTTFNSFLKTRFRVGVVINNDNTLGPVSKRFHLQVKMKGKGL